MSGEIKILCSNEIYALGLKEALKSENITIIKNKRDLSEREILITDRYFYNRRKIIMIYDDIYKALLGNEKIKILYDTSIEELTMALKAAKKDKSYIDSRILKARLDSNQLITQIEGLNRRQRELIKGILKNMTNYEIAKSLYISEKTVKNNLTDLYKKIGVNSRLELREKIYQIKL